MLQDAGVKVDSVASSITTKSARAMIEALIDGNAALKCSLIWPRARCAPRLRIWRGRWRAGSLSTTR